MGERSGAAKSSRPWQLPDGLVNVAQTSAGMVRPGREKLCGKVEVDETYWGSAEFGGATGRKTLSKVLIIVAAEADGKRIGRIHMTLIEDFDRKTLHRFIQDNIELGSTVCTDGLNSYREAFASARSPGHFLAETVAARNPPRQLFAQIPRRLPQ